MYQNIIYCQYRIVLYCIDVTVNCTDAVVLYRIANKLSNCQHAIELSTCYRNDIALSVIILSFCRM